MSSTFLLPNCAPRHNAVHMFIISISRPSIFFTFFTSKNASRHSGAGFFDIAISKNASKLRCFVFSDLEMCLAPQRRATFQTSRFSEPTFRPSGATNHWKNVAFRDFSTFSRACIFFLLILSLVLSSFIFFLLSPFFFLLSSFFFLLSSFFFLLSPLFFLLSSFFFLLFSSLPFPSLLFSSLTLPTSAFSSVQIVGSLTSKLPSMSLSGYSQSSLTFLVGMDENYQPARRHDFILPQGWFTIWHQQRWG